MPFSWMLLYVQLFFFVAQFIPFFGMITYMSGLHLPDAAVTGPVGARPGLVAGFHFFQIFTYSLITPGFFMLLINLLGIYTCAQVLEHRWGEKRFLFFYAVCALGDALLQLLVAALASSKGAVFGSAGPMFGLLLALFLLHRDEPVDPPWLPKMHVTTFVIGVTMAAFLLGRGMQSFSVQITHLVSGVLFGWLLLMYWRWKEPLPEEADDEDN